MIQIFNKSLPFSGKTAIISNGKSYSYAALHQASANFAQLLLEETDDLAEGRVAFMVNPGFDYVRVQWGIWQAGGIVVPLCLSYPLPSLRYTIENSGASVIVVSPEFEETLKDLADELACRLVVLGKNDQAKTLKALPEIDDARGAMILYTSGTTNLPKGVVSTHANLNAQISSLIEAWKWSSDDSTVCVLPLHHVHGVVNVVSCSLWAGASCEFMPNFSEKAIFDLIESQRINVFMAVPTIYFKLITYWEALPKVEQNAATNSLAKLRLMISGSAALPVSVMERWKNISTHLLLERYGMTEIGMALSNPYDGPRVAGHVGYPLPGVSVRLSDEGEIQVKGATVFKEYWNKPESTAESFTADGWFMTGDIATIDELGGYRILGRNSVDIIKSGGYKISALEIEEVLRQYPGIADCSVVGLPNDEWGELVAAAIVTKNQIDDKALHAWMREQMPAYKTPRKYVILADLPRNAMGKVTKKDVVHLIQ
ncbi:acyl-CoA synthetase [Aquirufa sp.]|jgi:malonyl-CoA/methylmalonyl-CoA synthetase|uniref:acyl-CoA synthetase n=1 Tax=Aquirufa sp. TaxID=2676249 RepID=UPI0037C064FB